MLSVTDGFYVGLGAFLTIPGIFQFAFIGQLVGFSAFLIYSGIGRIHQMQYVDDKKLVLKVEGGALVLAGALIPLFAFFMVMVAMSVFLVDAREMAEVLDRKHEECAVSGGAWIRGSDVSPFVQSFCVPGRD